jgi:hypothetical protein
LIPRQADGTVTMGLLLSWETQVPTTARLSRRFYDTFGDENTNELVGLLNAMDATYLGELRALNETNFARFDAKLEQRVAELRTEVAVLRGEMLAGFARIGTEVARGNVVALRWFIALTLTTLLSVGGAALSVLFAR